MKAAVCVIALCLLAAPVLGTSRRTLLQTADALRAACPEYSQYFGATSDGLDDCAIKALTDGAAAPSAACCAAAAAFVDAGCNADSIVIGKVASIGCAGFSSPCGALGECST